MTAVVDRPAAAGLDAPGGAGRWPSLGAHALLAALTYVPLLLTAQGRVAADTKTYLYVDPDRLLSRAAFMWDPGVGLGTVTHQTIGYLFPMGPWFWILDHLGAPDWVAQRLWVATIMFAAGAGVLFLLRTLGWRVAASLPAAILYALSPYVLHYAARISVILLAFAALPWLVALAQRAVTRGGWRHPAAFALVAAAAGSVNATALVLAGVGPLLWLPFAVLSHRDASARQAVGAALRIGLLTTLCSLWWIAGLAVQGGWGIDILRYTETLETVARTSLASEALRGLGYWFFYGGDKLGPWIEPGHDYTQLPWLIAVGFSVPLAAAVSALVVRWRQRAYFAAIVVTGTVLAVGAHPFDAPSPLGALFAAAAESSAGLALRSTPRALPLVALGTSVLVGAGVAAVARRGPRLGAVAGVLAVGLAVANLPPLWNGTLIGENLQRDEDLPRYWQEAAEWLDAAGTGRVLEVPGSDFASYRWGNTVDPITPGLLDRPFVARELIPWGSPPSADLVIALDRRMQEGVLEPAALAPVARLMGAGHILLRSDLQYERYRTPRPRLLWRDLDGAPGLGAAVPFGRPAPNRAIPRLPLLDEVELSIPPGAPHPPPVAVFPVESVPPVVSARPSEGPVVVAGDAEGVVEAAAAGLVDGTELLLFAADLAARPRAVEEALDAGGVLLLTDSNRVRARRWGTVRENSGYTEAAGEVPLDDDPSDNRLPVFPDAPADAFTTAERRGVRRVAASTYGNPVSWTPEDRAANALDGDVFTAWRVGAFAPVAGERLLVELDSPVTTDSVTLVQPVTGPRNRYLTRVELRFDGTDAGRFVLDRRSRTREGQVLRFPRRTFKRLEVVVRGDNVGRRARYDGWSSVGLAEVRLPGVRVDEVVRLPSHLLSAAGARSLDHPLAVLVARQRANPSEPVRTDEEQAITRAFALPAGRDFSLGGTARLSALVADEVIDRLLGIPDAAAGGLTARSSGRLPGSLAHRAWAAVDGDPATAWSPGFGPQEGQWLEVALPRRLDVDALDLLLVADGRHSVPTRVRVETDEGHARSVDLPPVAAGAAEGATRRVRVPVGVGGRSLRLTVEAVRATDTIDYYGERPLTMPVGIAELGLPGAAPPRPPAALPSACHDDLLAVDGRPVALRLAGTPADAIARAGLRLEPCDDRPLRLAGGDHELRAAAGRRTGIDVDRLVLRSAAGGSAGPQAGRLAPPGRAAPSVQVLDDGLVARRVVVRGATEPFWLVLGESHNRGWQARVEGAGRLEGPVLVDAYANGWLVDPAAVGSGGELEISLRWTPQRMVWAAIAASAAAVVACVVIALRPLLTRRHGAGRRRRASSRPAIEIDLPRAQGVRPPARVALVTVAAVSAAAAAAAHPGLGVLAGVGTAAGVRWRHGRTVVAAAGLAALAAAGGYTVARQWRNRFPPDFGWPQLFEPAHWLALTALTLVGAVLVAGAVRARAAVDKSRNQQG